MRILKFDLKAADQDQILSNSFFSSSAFRAIWQYRFYLPVKAVYSHKRSRWQCNCPVTGQRRGQGCHPTDPSATFAAIRFYIIQCSHVYCSDASYDYKLSTEVGECVSVSRHRHLRLQFPRSLLPIPNINGSNATRCFFLHVIK